MFFQFFKLLSNFLVFFLSVQSDKYVYKKVGDTKIDAIVYQPTYNTSAINGLKSPVLLEIHGGAYVLGQKTGSGSLSPREIQELSSRGWTVVSINYRLAPSVFISDIVEDVQSAYSWIKHKLPKKNPSPIDKNLIVVLGRSSGGGLALTLSLCQFQRKPKGFHIAEKGLISGYKFEPRPTAIISFFPYCSNFLDSFAYDSTHLPSDHLVQQVKSLKKKVAVEAENLRGDPRWDLQVRMFKENKGGWLLVSHDPHEDPNTIRQKLKEFSAVENVDQNYPPTYLSHGKSDNLVPYNQSVLMAKRLKQHDRDVVLDLPPHSRHSYDFNPSEEVWRKHVLPAFDWADIQVEKAAKTKHKKD